MRASLARASACTDLLFAPSWTAVNNLAHEGITGPHVQLVGDVMYDAALFSAAQAEARGIRAQLGLEPRRFVLRTCVPPTSVGRVAEGVRAALAEPPPAAPATDLYGGGKAASRIAGRLLA